MKSVCHIITRMILGGAQENTLLTVKGLHEDPDYTVELVTGPALGPEGELIEEARSFGVDPVIIDSMRREINPVNEIKAFVKICSYLRSNDFDIVHTHSSKAGILGRWAARFADVPWILHTIHGLPFHEYQPFWKNYTFKLIEQMTASFTHKILSVCDRMSEKAKSAGVNPIKGFGTVYSGMELDPFLSVPDPETQEAKRIRSELGFNENHFVFGKIARLFHLKGHSYCFKAFQTIAEKYDNARLMLVGDGILRDELESLADELGIRDQVKFTGLVPYEEIPRMLTAMDVLVHTSLREGLARVIPQAQAAGRPVISYDIDGAPEAITSGETGFLVPPQSINELSEKMFTLLENPQRRAEFSSQAREWVTPQFDWTHMVSEIKDVYDDLLD